MVIERRLSPEEEELRAKKAELEALLDQLAQKTLELETFHGEIETFFRRYNSAVEPKVVESKRLQARIARAIYALDPTEEARTNSQHARTSADQAESDYRGQPEPPQDEDLSQPPKFTPSQELKEIYRNLVKAAHPDLAKDEDERLKRTEFMTRVNQAYQNGDEATLIALSDEWNAGKDPVESDSIGEQLIQVIRQIAHIRNRISQSEIDIEEVQQSEDYLLVKQSEEASDSGRDLIAEHVAKIDAHIEDLTFRIDDIKGRLSSITQP